VNRQGVKVGRRITAEAAHDVDDLVVEGATHLHLDGVGPGQSECFASSFVFAALFEELETLPAGPIGALQSRAATTASSAALSALTSST